MFNNILPGKYNKGIRLLKKGNIDDAEKLFSEMIKADPFSVGAYIELARISFKRNRLSELRAYLNKLLEIDQSEKTKKAVLEITNWRLISSHNYHNHPPCFSPDGKRLAYASARRDTNNDGRVDAEDCPGLYIYDLSTNREYRMLGDNYYNSMPAFSPDSGRLVYLSAREASDKSGIITRTDRASLYVSDLETGEEMRLPIAGRIKFPSFSSGGRKVVYSCWKDGEDRNRIYYYDLDIKREFPVTIGMFESTFPYFERDSNRVLYCSWRGRSGTAGFSSIVFGDCDTLEEKVLTKGEYDDSYPSFSLDGENIVYLSRRRDTNRDGEINSLDNANICVYNLEKGKDRVLVNDKFYNKFPTFSFDGKKVLFLSSWRRDDVIFARREDYFDSKGVYCVDVSSLSVKNIVNEKYYGCRFPHASPSAPLVAYLSWRKGTNRGVYLADYDRIPDEKELKKYIENNLQ